MVIGFGNEMNLMGNSYMTSPYMAASPMFGGRMNPMMMGNSYLNFKNSDDMKSFYNTQIDDSQSNIYASGQGRISQKAYMIAQQLKGALESENDTEVKNILTSIEGDKYQLAGVELAYDQMSGGRCALRTDIRENLEGSKAMEQVGLGGVNGFLHQLKASLLKPFGYNPISQREAIDILNEGATVNTTVAANALKDATFGFGTDRKTVDYIMANTNGRMAEISSSYQQMGDLTQDIRKSYNPFIDGFGTQERITGQIATQLAS